MRYVKLVFAEYDEACFAAWYIDVAYSANNAWPVQWRRGYRAV